MSSTPPAFTVLYDGECPFCNSYVSFARLRDAVGAVELIDAREAPELVAEYASRGYPIDGGMIVDTGENVFYGGDAVWAINTLVGRNPLLKVFSGRTILNWCYPAMRFCRNAVVRLLGKTPIQSK